MVWTLSDRAKWLLALAAMTAVMSGGVASAHQGETGPGHHADDPPAAASAQTKAAGTSGDGAGAGTEEKTDAAPTSTPEDPDPTVPLLILAVVLAVGTGWVAWKRRGPEEAEGS